MTRVQALVLSLEKESLSIIAQARVEATITCSVIESYRMENDVLNQRPPDVIFADLISDLKRVGHPAVG